MLLYKKFHIKYISKYMSSTTDFNGYCIVTKVITIISLIVTVLSSYSTDKCMGIGMIIARVVRIVQLHSEH